MKAIKKMAKFNLHLRIFILLSITIWLLVGVLHLNILFAGNHISLGGIIIPRIVNYFALVGITCMTVMGMYYYIALKPSKNKETK